MEYNIWKYHDDWKLHTDVKSFLNEVKKLTKSKISTIYYSNNSMTKAIGWDIIINNKLMEQYKSEIKKLAKEYKVKLTK